MRLWTIQFEIIYEVLKTEKIICCDPSKSYLLTEYDFSRAYDWMVAQMKLRIFQLLLRRRKLSSSQRIELILFFSLPQNKNRLFCNGDKTKELL
jgi:hypothetical protein